MYKRLKILREKNNLTKKDISNKLEIPYTLYSNYENGIIEIPLHILSKLAKFYNTSIDYIVEDTDSPLPHIKNWII